MSKYLFTFYLPAKSTREDTSMMNANRQMLQQLMRDDVIVTYAENRERNKSWIVLNAASLQEAYRYIEKLPMTRFLNHEAEELCIFDSMMGAPRIILN